MTEDSSIKANTLENLVGIADQFVHQGRAVDIREYGEGNVNDTYLVELDSEKEKHFILQRINTQVFREPELVMRNMRTVTEHIRERLERTPLGPGRRWEAPRVLLTEDSRDHWIGPDESFWRASSFIGSSRSFHTITDIGHAREVGWALGVFHSLISDLPAEDLADTLKGFHVTPQYLRHYDEVLLDRRRGKSSAEAQYGYRFVSERREWAHVLEDALERGVLHHRPIHGDPKVDNVMIDNTTRQAVSIVDLDTVKPGLVHYDIGDCLRSGCNLLGEETEQWEGAHFETDICHAIMQGYVSMARDFLTEKDREYLFDAIRLIPFELGLRFFTDYLEGNVYFKARHPEHNLIRALMQFRLTESIEAQERSIRAIIRDMK